MTRTLQHRILATLGALAAATLLLSGCTHAAAPTGGQAAAGPSGATAPATTPPAAATATVAPKPAKRQLETMTLPSPITTIAQPTKGRTIAGPRTMPVPMLMYHAIDTAPANAPYPDLYVTPKQFAAQLNYLTTHGYHAVTMQQVYDFWNGKGTLPSKPVVLTFDDGFAGDFTYATPLLKSVNWPATLFLIVGTKKPRMPASMVRAMIGAGWELGSHTIHHLELPSESSEGMMNDVSGSRVILRKRYGVPVNFFCYPAGKYNAATIADVQQAGYLLATTTHPGVARPSEPYALHRIRVSGSQSLASFAALLGK